MELFGLFVIVEILFLSGLGSLSAHPDSKANIAIMMVVFLIKIN